MFQWWCWGNVPQFRKFKKIVELLSVQFNDEVVDMPKIMHKEVLAEATSRGCTQRRYARRALRQSQRVHSSWTRFDMPVIMRKTCADVA